VNGHLRDDKMFVCHVFIKCSLSLKYACCFLLLRNFLFI
jgi:hypothetical protein